ncbi:MAG: protein-export chaperone SecB, partial [Pseudomonadales bacterium]|nr:protein-export chaperone SecB [Pseudomonadales bacterium]
AQIEEETAFVAEVHNAGIFTVKEFDDTNLEHILATVCPSILFPYSRETIDSLVVRGSFPPLNLSPINFEALYAQQKQAAEQQAAGGEAPAPENVQ